MADLGIIFLRRKHTIHLYKSLFTVITRSMPVRYFWATLYGTRKLHLLKYHAYFAHKRLQSLSEACSTIDLLHMDCVRRAFLWSDDRHGHLVVCMLMSTSKRLDNDDYVIMQRHWQNKHFPPVRYNLAGVPLWIRLWINTTECSGAAKLKTLQFLWYDLENYWFAHFRTRMRVCPT